MADSNDTKLPNSSPEIRALLGQAETDQKKAQEKIAALEKARDENIMDDAFCESIEDDIFKTRKEQGRFEKRIERLQEKLKEITDRENKESALRVADEARLAADLVVDLLKKSYVSAAREVAGILHYYEKSQILYERACWYAKQAGIKCDIPTLKTMIYKAGGPLEELPAMCNLPDIRSEPSAHWTPDKSRYPSPPNPTVRGVSGSWRRHEINLPDFEDILKAANPAGTLAKIIQQYATNGQAVEDILYAELKKFLAGDIRFHGARGSLTPDVLKEILSGYDLILQRAPTSSMTPYWQSWSRWLFETVVGNYGRAGIVVVIPLSPITKRGPV